MISFHGLLGPQPGLLTGETDGRGVGEGWERRPQMQPVAHAHTHCSAIQSQPCTTPRAHTQLCAPIGLQAPRPLHIHTINGKTHQIHTCEHTPDNLGLSIQADGNANTQTYTHTMYTCMKYNQRKRCIPCTHPHIEKYQARTHREMTLNTLASPHTHRMHTCMIHSHIPNIT